MGGGSPFHMPSDTVWQWTGFGSLWASAEGRLQLGAPLGRKESRGRARVLFFFFFLHFFNFFF